MKLVFGNFYLIWKIGGNWGNSLSPESPFSTLSTPQSSIFNIFSQKWEYFLPLHTFGSRLHIDKSPIETQLKVGGKGKMGNLGKIEKGKKGKKEV
ncbi:MAG: hypothetical protein C6I01_00310 [Epsilonproteobacteria bacterium]|nr:hypothetical protein [Campylobacterota bacterium]